MNKEDSIESLKIEISILRRHLAYHRVEADRVKKSIKRREKAIDRMQKGESCES